MELTKGNTFTECETGYVEHHDIHNERTHGNLQAMRFHHVNQPTGTQDIDLFLDFELSKYLDFFLEFDLSLVVSKLYAAYVIAV